MSSVRNWQQLVREADPDFDRESLRPWVYEFSNGRVRYDVSTTPGDIIIGVRRNSGDGGTEFDGSMAVTVTGFAANYYELI